MQIYKGSIKFHSQKGFVHLQLFQDDSTIKLTNLLVGFRIGFPFGSSNIVG